MTRLAVAAISARYLSEAAARDGYEVAALDLFGDQDTRRAAARWQSIGAAGGLEIDAERLLSSLQEMHRQGEYLGWVAGSGFEGRTDLLEAGAQALRLIGTPSNAVGRVRDPGIFFATLDAHGIPHPPLLLTPPPNLNGWLFKDAHACGGWHVQRWTGSVPPALKVGQYLQREQAGSPMSATFVANGREARLVGFNLLLTQAIGDSPFVFGGVVGPVDLPPAVTHALKRAVQIVTREFGLLGWCGLDFMLTAEGEFAVLELNPRPPASQQLYAGPGAMNAQLLACLQAQLPEMAAFSARHVGGCQIVYAEQAFTVEGALAGLWAADAQLHDLPTAGTRFSAGEPVCTVSAAGHSSAQVISRLAAKRRALLSAFTASASLNILETQE